MSEDVSCPPHGPSETLRAEAAALDAADPLAGVRGRYDLVDSVTYLDGNSLGVPAKAVAGRMHEVISQEWGRRLIRSWPDTWWQAPERVGELIAPLVGAAPGQVVVADSTSVDLFKALVAAGRMRPDRGEIVVDAATFPTDGYIAAAVARLLGLTVRAVDPAEMPGAVDARTAVVLANQVDYRTGRLHDMATITTAAHDVGAVMVWDLCHSVGVVPIALDALGVDLAVGCTYKFLSGGPGSPAFSYVRRDLHHLIDQPITGWGGHAAPFAMAAGYSPAIGIERMRSGTPDILSLLALEAALSAYDDVAIADVRAKSLSLTGFFIRCIDSLLPARAVEVRTPRRDTERGSQVSLACAGAEEIMDRLIAGEVIGDFRPPDILRFGFAPLYTRHLDAFRAALAVRNILVER